MFQIDLSTGNPTPPAFPDAVICCLRQPLDGRIVVGIAFLVLIIILIMRARYRKQGSAKTAFKYDGAAGRVQRICRRAKRRE